MSKQTGRAPSQGHASRIRKSISAIQELRQAALAVEVDFAKILAQVNPRFRGSARNLLHYLAVRQHDIRDLQHELGRLGLSSLGRMEAHVMASLNAVLEALNLLIKRPQPEDLEDSAAISFERGLALLAQNTEAILGPGDATRMTRVMVTVPGEAAENPLLIRNLLAQGMNIMRINCAHDTPQVWSKMVRHLRRAQAGQGRPCKVSFDLAGPKLRTGPMQAGESVIKWRPFKDRLGRTVAPVEVSLVCAASYTEGGMSGAVPIAGDLPALARTGDHVELVDARGKQRCLLVTGKEDHGCRCQADSTAYVTPGNSVALRRKRKLIGRSRVAMFPSQKTTAITLRPGDILDLVNRDVLGRPATLDERGNLVEPALIGCSLPEVFSSARRNERIFFDDGRIAGKILSVDARRIRVEIVIVAGETAKLRGEKGINLPDTNLRMAALSAKDLEDLNFMAKHADMLAFSYVQRPEDIRGLISVLKQLGASHLGMILKIETQQAFSRLPALLLEAMRHYPVAVMVARGDLGVEVGFERLSEVQEEILWLCEAAHVPVVWATQVLESLAKEGIPSRAEVTDAAMGCRAECVMLNKGPYILQTMKFLCDVLNRMQDHHQKKSSMLRKLSISEMRKSARK